MTLDSGAYDITQFQFDEEALNLADRTHRRLHALFVGTNMSRDDLYYVAASAVECLVNRRADYLNDLACGYSLAECDARARVGRVDTHFYFALARSWAVERRVGPAARTSRAHDRYFAHQTVA